jgi:hypothetical protein
MAIHHACKVAAITEEGVVSLGFTVYRGKNQVDCLLSGIIKRVGIYPLMKFRPQLRPFLLRRSADLQGVKTV